MNNEIDLIASQNLNAEIPSNVVPISRARSFKIRASKPNFEQVVNTIKALAVAGMPFVYAANGSEAIGELVERRETDAPIKDGWQTKAGEIAEKEGEILAWQNREESITLVPQIGSPIGSSEIIPFTPNAMTNSNTPQTINVIEGISASQQQPSLVDAIPSNITDISQNRYLNAPAILKKAA